MLVRSTNTPVNTHDTFSDVPPNNNGMPGKVYANIALFLLLLSDMFNSIG